MATGPGLWRLPALFFCHTIFSCAVPLICCTFANEPMGRHKAQISCPYSCGRKFGARELQRHIAHCPKKPKEKNK